MRSRPFFFLVLGVAFSTLITVTDVAACPEGFGASSSACVAAGKPDPKDNIVTVGEFQSACRDSSKFPGTHAQPVMDDDSCLEGEQLWECCESSAE